MAQASVNVSGASDVGGGERERARWTGIGLILPVKWYFG